MNNVVSLKVVREMKQATKSDPAYHARILSMDKLDLLEEMMRFQMERTQLGHLTLLMMIQGQVILRPWKIERKHRS